MTTQEPARDTAIALLKAGRYGDAIRYLDEALRSAPRDWELLHGMAMAVEATKGLVPARWYFDEALRARPNDTRTLSALGLALYRAKRFDESKEMFFKAITADNNFEDAYVGLAVAQRESGELEKSLHNFDAAATAMARQLGTYVAAHNSPASKVYPFRSIGKNLWMEHAMFGALYLCSLESSVSAVAVPTDQMAEEEYRTRSHSGLYFVDTQNGADTSRLFLPNYFDSFREWLVGNLSYAAICHGKARVLSSMGRADDARAHAFEAEAFQRETASRSER